MYIRIVLFSLLFVVFAASCTNTLKEEVNSLPVKDTKDTAITDVGSILDYELPDKYLYDDEQTDSGFYYLKSLHESFLEIARQEQVTLPFFTIEYFGAYDITNTTFIFDSGLKIRTSIYDNASEGGYEEQLFELFENDSVVFVAEYVGSGGETTRKYWMRGMDHFIGQTVKWDEKPEIILEKISEGSSINWSDYIRKTDLRIKAFLDSTGKKDFKRVGNNFHFRKARMENSEYGPVETGKDILMDSLVFEKYF